MGPCRRAAPLLALAAACTWPNPDFDTGAGGSGSLTGGSPTTGDPPTASGSAATEASGGLSASSGLTTSPGPDPSTSSTAADSTGSSGAVEQLPEHLQLYIPENCDEPLWCYNTQQGVFSGLPRLVRSSVCFVPTMPPPYRVTRVGYIIAATFGDLSGDTRLEVHALADGGPGNLLYDQLLDPAALVPGYDEVSLTTPPTIEKPGFCVGLSGGRSSPGAGLGVAVDPSGPALMEAYYAGGCNGLPWTDILELKPNPTGRWCIDADVTAL